MTNERTACGGVVLAMVGVGLLAVTTAWGAEPVWPALPQESLLLLAPKGKAETVSGMTAKGGAAAKEDTAMNVAWDDEGLSVTFDCTDSGVAAEWAKGRDSTTTWKDDSVAVLLDVGHRHVPSTNFLSFKLSAAGGLQDCRGVNRDIAYNVAGLTSDVSRTATGWRGTIRIPWQGLGTTPREGETWGVNFTRIDHEGKYGVNMKFMAWAPFAEDFEGLQHFGHLVFMAKDAPTDAAAVAAVRETVKKAHAVIVAETVFPNEDNVVTAKGNPPGSAAGFSATPSGAAPKQATSVAVGWGDGGLDVTFDCVDSGIVGDQKGRDNIKLWRDDSVYVWLDPGHTHNAERNLTMVQVSAGGEVHDVRNGDLKFDIEGLVAQVSRTEKGWRAHLLMPWKGLGVERPEPGEVWGINFSRMDQPGKTDYANMESSSWAAIPNGDALALDRWGQVIFATTDADVTAGQQAIKKSHEARQRAIVGKGAVSVSP